MTHARHLQVNLGSTSDAVESVANVTDVHEAMLFHADDELTARSSFGIWSLRWSPDGREVIAGTGDSSLYIYDVEQQKVCFVFYVEYFDAIAGIGEKPLRTCMMWRTKGVCVCCF